MTKAQKHRSGSLKQSNKLHKTGRHRSKGAVNSVTKGKVSVKNLSKNAKKELGREARRLQSKQIRQLKCDELKDLKRKLHNSEIPPHLISIIPLNENVDINPVINTITGSSGIEVAYSSTNLNHISLPKFKQKYSMVSVPVGNTFATLDVAKISSIIVFLIPATTEDKKPLDNQMIDDWGREILEQCISQGLPNIAVVLTNLKHIAIKKQHDVKKKLQDSISKWLPEEKVSVLDSETDAMNLLRRLGGQKPKLGCFHDRRPHLLAEHFEYGYDENEFGILKVRGYLRGKPLSANGLVHIPGFGDYQMTQITAMKDPFSPEKDGQEFVVQTADPKEQESLERENVPDPMDAEQTWPTAEELAESDAKNANKKLVKLVPKGTSEYQAAWIPDVHEESDNESEGSDHEMSVEKDDSDSESKMHDDDEDADEYEELTTTSEVVPDEQKYDEQMDLMEERQMMEKIKEAKMDNQFPDEVDTPENILAKVRFQKYRGLESFRTSPWDPKENLPYDYSRIFQFQNFERTRRRIHKLSDQVQGATPGKYVTLYIKGVSKELYDAHRTVEGRPLVVFGLLPNEHKMSLVNVILKRRNHPGMQPIKSKEKLIFQCGFRRFTASPIFSQHTNGSKHKYTRFFQENETIVASMYAPITFSPCPVLCYKKDKHNILDLIATGSVLSVDPNRLVIKRAVLSGHPFKVHKRSAVIRFMFYYREDILWFKPVQLHTKYGRRGHIREPLGTHGHMKCVFDGQLKSQDTVLLNLYKRVFPKWTYEDYLLTME